jgi:hypothetical protein
LQTDEKLVRTSAPPQSYRAFFDFGQIHYD